MQPQAGVLAPPRGPPGRPPPQLSCSVPSPVSHPPWGSLLLEHIPHGVQTPILSTLSQRHISDTLSPTSPLPPLLWPSSLTAWLGWVTPLHCPALVLWVYVTHLDRCVSLPPPSVHPHTAGRRQINIDYPVCRTEREKIDPQTG